MTELKLKVLHIIDSAASETGGPIQSIIQLAAHQSQDVETTLVTLDLDVDFDKHTLPFTAYHLGSDDRFRRATGIFRLTPKLVSWLRQHASSYDVAVFHGIWTFAPLGGWLGLKRSGLPYVIFPHGMMDPWFRKTYPIKHIKKQIFWTLLLGRILARAGAVIFTAEDERLLARNVFRGYQHYPESVIPLGVERNEIDSKGCIDAFRGRLPEAHHRKFLLYLSRIHPKKGPDILIEAFSRFSYDHADYDLIIAGPDTFGWRKTLEAKAHQLGIAERIHWPGMLTGPAKWGAFYSAEAFILPSHQENFGMVVAEALSCGRPVLISNKVNIWKEVDRSGAGFVAEDTFAGTLSLMQRFAALNPTEKQQMSENAKTCHADHFDARTNASRFTELLQAVSLNKIAD